VNPLKAQGQWWTAEAADRQVVGELDFTDKRGATLTLVGETFGEQVSGGPGNWTAPTIFGSIPGYDVTLLDAVQMPTGWRTHGPATQRLHVEHVLLGGHITEPLFDKCQVRTSLLESWAQFGGFEVRPDFDPGTVGFRYTLPPPCEATLEGGVKLTLHCRASETHGLSEHTRSSPSGWCTSMRSSHQPERLALRLSARV
jgi:hypothetical protein